MREGREASGREREGVVRGGEKETKGTRSRGEGESPILQ